MGLPEKTVSAPEGELLRRAVIAGGDLVLNDGEAVGDGITALLQRGLVCISGAIGDNALQYRLTPAGWTVATMRRRPAGHLRS